MRPLWGRRQACSYPAVEIAKPMSAMYFWTTVVYRFSHERLILKRSETTIERARPMTTRRFPNIAVLLVGHDGNAFSILGRCQRAMREAGLDAATQFAFTTEATAGNYDNLLRTVMSWFAVDGETDGAE